MGFMALAFTLYFAATLGIAGLGKLEDPGSFLGALRHQALLPAWSIPFIGYSLPWLEIGLAVLLVLGWAPPLTAVAVLLLFLVFTGVKTTLLVTKSTANCGCGGKIRKAQPVDGPAVAASVVVTLFAVAQLWLSTHVTMPLWPWRLVPTILMLSTVIGACTLIWMRNRARLRQAQFGTTAPENRGGLAPNSLAPSFTTVDERGTLVRLEDVLGHRVILAFTAPGCPACETMLKALTDWQRNENREDIRALVFGWEDMAQNQAYAAKYRISILTAGNELRAAYQIQAFPTLFALDERGVIRARGGVPFAAHLRGLLRAAYEEPQNVQSDNPSAVGATPEVVTKRLSRAKQRLRAAYEAENP